MSTHARHSRGLHTMPVTRTPERAASVLAWKQPRPQALTALMCDKRLAEAAADQAEYLAELCLGRSEIGVRRWGRAARVHRTEAAILTARISHYRGGSQ